jgi:hypothetical protein
MNDLVDRALGLLMAGRSGGNCSSEPEPSKPVTLEPGSLIWWRGMDDKTRGPALLRGTFEDEGHVWAWFVLAGTEYLIRADLIVKVQGAGEP